MAALLAGCGTSPTGRQQFLLVSPDAAISMAETSYLSTLQRLGRAGKLMDDPQLLARLERITGRVVTVAVRDYPHTARWQWSLALVDNKSANAWAMAGGRIAVYRGLIEVLNLDDAELAHIIGHEIAHAIANHHAERMSMVVAQNLAVAVVDRNTDDPRAAPLTNTVASIALTLPNSRSSEEEADSLGMRLATKAGYDPQAAVSLWQKMAQHSKSEPLEFLSTHPNHASRITAMAAMVEEVRHLQPAVPPVPARIRLYSGNR